MIILPAIDIIDGKPVRLYQGDYGKQEQVAQSVVETACTFAGQGAQWLHLVDLDGARMKRPVNRDLILEAVRASGLPAEVGGGIRTMEDIAGYLDHGLARVILGTSALQDPELVREAVARYGDRIAVGIDAKDGLVMVDGWMGQSGRHYLDVARQMEQMGVRTLIFTDISRDGTLSGPNLEMLKALQQAVQVHVIASGGIHHLQDIEALAALDLHGAITGKAMYAGTLDLQEAIAAGQTSAADAAQAALQEGDVPC